VKVYVWEGSSRWDGKAVVILAETEADARRVFAEQNPVNEAAKEAVDEQARDTFWAWAKEVNGKRQAEYEAALSKIPSTGLSRPDGAPQRPQNMTWEQWEDQTEEGKAYRLLTTARPGSVTDIDGEPTRVYPGTEECIVVANEWDFE